MKAWITNKIEPWITFSPRNTTAVVEAARRVLKESTPRLLTERSLGGKQQ